MFANLRRKAVNFERVTNGIYHQIENFSKMKWMKKGSNPSEFFSSEKECIYIKIQHFLLSKMRIILYR